MRQDKAVRRAAVQRLEAILKIAFGRDFSRGEIEAAAVAAFEAIDLAERSEYLGKNLAEQSAAQLLITYALTSTDLPGMQARAAVRALSSR